MARHERFLKVQDLMEVLNISRSVAYRLINEGHFHCAKFGGCLRISALSVERYINRRFEAFTSENGIPLDE